LKSSQPATVALSNDWRRFRLSQPPLAQQKTCTLRNTSHSILLPSDYMDPRIRVLVAKPGLDGHDRGAKVIARALRDAGMEVIYTGLRQTPEMIVSAALQEDVQVIGLSILSGAHNAIVPRIMDLLREKGMDDVLVLVGGIIPDEDAAELKKLGVAAVFQPGASLEAIVDFIRSSVKQTA
jgi:methylmalonyl-CoA mutase C-terminal domain/subunit